MGIKLNFEFHESSLPAHDLIKHMGIHFVIKIKLNKTFNKRNGNQKN